MRRKPDVKTARILHWSFWLAYSLASVILFFGFWRLKLGGAMRPEAFNVISALVFMAVQEVLFIYFLFLEQRYVRFIKSGRFYAALLASNAFVAGALVLAGYWGGVPPGLSSRLFSGNGLVSGNLGTALALLMAFAVAPDKPLRGRSRSSSR